jgi:predicted RNase H-like HicB family nuclease
MKLNVTIDRGEDGVWIVECPAILGCVSQSRTNEEALANAEDAIAVCFQMCVTHDHDAR